MAGTRRSRIVVAMSGGVDSSVTAALLAREGHEVIGVTLQLYDHGKAIKREGACCAGQDIHDARRVADRLGVAHYVLDFEERFRRAVIDDFAASYARGETPLPCVRCNERVKFRDLLEIARDLGAEALATGHYVRRIEGSDGPELHRAVDATRDQSYFLFATTRAQLDFLRFPLGDMAKSEVRVMAAEFGLPVKDKPDSQDICFVPSGRYTEMVKRLNPAASTPGEIVHVDGRVLGAHPGVIHFTVGQRRGIGVGGDLAGGDPLYVVRIDAAAHRVVVGPKAALGVDTIQLRDVSWLAGEAEAVDAPAEIMIRVRSSQPLVPAVLSRDGTGATVFVADPLDGVAPGQACVFYRGDRVLGGGWIASTERQRAAA